MISHIIAAVSSTFILQICHTTEMLWWIQVLTGWRPLKYTKWTAIFSLALCHSLFSCWKKPRNLRPYMDVHLSSRSKTQLDCGIQSDYWLQLQSGPQNHPPHHYSRGGKSALLIPIRLGPDIGCWFWLIIYTLQRCAGLSDLAYFSFNL